MTVSELRVPHMTAEPTASPIPVELRRAIFRALIEAQDGGASVQRSRADVLHRYAVTEDQLKAIEVEGMGHEWPPL